MFSRDLITRMDESSFAINKAFCEARDKGQKLSRDDIDALDTLIERLLKIRAFADKSIATHFFKVEAVYFDENITDCIKASPKIKAFYDALPENGKKVFYNEVYHNYQSCAGEESFPFMENAIEATMADMVDFDENDPNWARAID